MSNPIDPHYNASLRVLRYLKSSPGQGLFFPSSSSLQLKAFLDSDLATCLEMHKSIIDFCIYLSDSLIFWKSKKQPIVAHNSTEAKYKSITSTICELKWLTNILKELPCPPSNIPSYIVTTLLLFILQVTLHFMIARSTFTYIVIWPGFCSQDNAR
ncbi:hypothetical protein KIW84_054199 [Lathyrus oleraceus]|uniref:Mitochondrial protein n=1 Tax=Pisum sativum TaxID=3888 RepID=A0A9D4WX26_PEA|nr:hypothetical protein KIW84_054199 [Pisum sativum]